MYSQQVAMHDYSAKGEEEGAEDWYSDGEQHGAPISNSCSHSQAEASSEYRQWMNAVVKTVLTRLIVITIIFLCIAVLHVYVHANVMCVKIRLE